SPHLLVPNPMITMLESNIPVRVVLLQQHAQTSAACSTRRRERIMAKQDEVRRNEAADRERDQEWLATGRDPARGAPKVRGRGTPRGRRHEEQSGTAPPN